MKQIELHRAELEWLRKQLRVRHLSDTKKRLNANSSLKNYELLSHLISKQTSNTDLDEYASSNLLRKLFYDTSASSSVIFRIGFSDACYRYLSNGAFNRHDYIDALDQNPALDPSNSHPRLLRENNGDAAVSQSLADFVFTRSKRFFTYGLSFAFVLILVLLAFKFIDLRTLPWIVSGSPHHTRWICEYQDGTKTFNRFREYRTREEVYAYYSSESRIDGDWGDCNSYMITGKNNHIPVCYKTKDGIEAIEREHGTPIKVYVDDESEKLHETD